MKQNRGSKEYTFSAQHIKMYQQHNVCIAIRHTDDIGVNIYIRYVYMSIKCTTKSPNNFLFSRFISFLFFYLFIFTSCCFSTFLYNHEYNTLCFGIYCKYLIMLYNSLCFIYYAMVHFKYNSIHRRRILLYKAQHSVVTIKCRANI